jgi:hypothetical protein
MTLMKEQVRKVLDDFPDEFAFDDLVSELFLLEKIARRAEMADRGNDFVSQADVEARMQKWLTK